MIMSFKQEETYLCRCIEFHQFRIVEALLKAGADVNEGYWVRFFYISDLQLAYIAVEIEEFYATPLCRRDEFFKNGGAYNRTWCRCEYRPIMGKQ